MSAAAADFDVAIVGGGPAGSCAAAYLSRAGRSVALLEAEKFPRFHIGESLLPSSNQIFDLLGCTQKVLDAGYTQKWGAVFYDERGRNEAIFDFGLNPQFADRHTFQVPRAEFDALLFEHARATGAKIFSGRARSAAFEADGVTLDWQDAQGGASTLRAKYLIDASGRAGFLAKTLGLRKNDATLQKVALYAHFKGVPRPEGRHAGSIRVISTPDLGWVWLIPLPQGVMSVGVVIDRAVFQNLEKGSTERAFDGLLERVPMAKQLLRQAERISDVRAESSFSYGTKTYIGDRWLLVGDAGSFLDPVFSSGVMFALHGGIEAARVLDESLGQSISRHAAFRAYERLQQKRYRFVRRFVRGFYREGFRDIFYRPPPDSSAQRSVLAVLGGAWDLSWNDRFWIEVFFLLTRIQRFIPLNPRLHRNRRVAVSAS